MKQGVSEELQKVWFGVPGKGAFGLTDPYFLLTSGAGL